MNKLKLGILLGAGASFAYGIPMMRQFYEQFIDYVRTRRSHCLPLLERLIAGVMTPDLEVLIQKLEQVRAMRSGLEVLAESANAVTDHLDQADELRGYLDMFLIETCEQFNQAKVKEKLSKLVHFASNRQAHIFTTNYDRLVEVAATSISVPYSDGFEFATSRPESMWNGTFGPGLPLIKLHGSVNWYEEQGTGSLFRLERGYSLPSNQYGLTHGARTLRPLMIIPTLEKAILRKPYMGLLTQFSDALKEMDLFIVIGNSLRDDHLRNTIAERAHRLNIVLVNPAARDQIDIFGHREITHAMPMGIDQFIELALDPLNHLLDDLMGEGADRRERIEAFAAQVTARADQLQEMDAEAREQLEALKSGPLESQLGVLDLVDGSSHPAIVDEVRRLLLDAVDEGLRVAAIDAFVAARGPDSAEVLGEIVRTPGSLSVRAEAALALRSLDGGAAFEVIKRTAEAVVNDQTMATLLHPPAS